MILHVTSGRSSRLPTDAGRRAIRAVSLPVICILWCFLLGIARAETPEGEAADSPTRLDPATYLLQAGPIGALVWGAYWLGKGVKLTVVVELSERDRALIMKQHTPQAA